MATHKISITASNATVGIPAESDGVVGLFIRAVAVAGKFVLNTPYALDSLSDLAALEIDAAYDITNGTDVYGQLSDYFAQAGDGALIWLIGVPMNTAYATYVADPLFPQLIQFTGQADPLNLVKVIGLAYNPPVTLQSATDFPQDVHDGIIAATAAQKSLFQLGFEIAIVYDGYNMSSTATPTSLATQATSDNFPVCLCITGIRPNGMSSVGSFLGRVARISVGHGVGNVADGPIVAFGAYLTNSLVAYPTSLLVVGHKYTVMGGAITYNAVVYQPGAQFVAQAGFTAFTTTANGYLVDNITPIGAIPGVITNSFILGLSPADINQLGQKQFLFLRTWRGKQGFYWNDGATCTGTDKAFSSIEYVRVVNRLSSDVLNYFVNEEGQNIPLDAATGDVAQAWINAKQQDFYSRYISPLTVDAGTGDITDGSLVITGPNFLATRKLFFKLSILPTVILGDVEGTVSLSATI